MIEWLCDEPSCSPVLRLAQLLNAAFLAILFLQSGMDKITDRKGNLEWLSGHFEGSPLADRVPLALSVVTGTELLAGAFSALGVFTIVVLGSAGPAFTGVVFSALSLIMLFLGQRLAKDYEGAAVLVPYFTLTIVGLYLFA